MSEDDHIILLLQWFNEHIPGIALALGVIWAMLVWAKKKVFKDYATVEQMDLCRDQICEKIDENKSQNREEHNEMSNNIIDAFKLYAHHNGNGNGKKGEQ